MLVYVDIVCYSTYFYLLGSAGFLGCFLLSSLIMHYKESKLFCLLRCKEESEGMYVYL